MESTLIVTAKNSLYYGKKCREVTKDKYLSLQMGDSWQVCVEMEDGEVVVLNRSAVKNNKGGRIEVRELLGGEKLGLKMLEILCSGEGMLEKEFFALVAPHSKGRAETNKVWRSLRDAGKLEIKKGVVRKK